MLHNNSDDVVTRLLLLHHVFPLWLHKDENKPTTQKEKDAGRILVQFNHATDPQSLISLSSSPPAVFQPVIISKQFCQF